MAEVRKASARDEPDITRTNHCDTHAHLIATFGGPDVQPTARAMSNVRVAQQGYN